MNGLKPEDPGDAAPVALALLEPVLAPPLNAEAVLAVLALAVGVDGPDCLAVTGLTVALALCVSVGG